MNKLQQIDAQIILDSSLLRQIDQLRTAFGSINGIATVLYGPSGPDDQTPVAKRAIITGSQLRTASTNQHQGKWLTKLAMHVGQKVKGRINALEIGTAAGISGLYILSGMSRAGGGRLLTFEGSPELADLARKNMERFIGENRLDNVDFEIVVGPFDQTIKPHLNSFLDVLHLAFIDGNHLEEATKDYHQLVRPHMHDQGIIVHDDIGWSPAMARAWNWVQETEGPGKTIELLMGGHPCRGVVLLDVDPTGVSEYLHLDGVVERYLRWAKRLLPLLFC